MGLQGKSGFVGIVTATAETTAGPGALRVADNVTLRRKGALTLRDGLDRTIMALSRSYRGAVSHQTSTVLFGMTPFGVFRENNNPLYMGKYSTSGWSQAHPTLVRNDIAEAVESRQNLYIATADGILKITSPSDGGLSDVGFAGSVGLTYDPFPSTGAGTAWMANNTHVAYRFVPRYDGPNGVIVRGRPSGQVIVKNQSGVTSYVVIGLNAGNIKTPISFIEIYRGRALTLNITPDDELQLVATVPGNTTTHTDTVAEIDRGMTIYTAPSRGGIENANDRPPAAACIERFRSSLFFANLRTPQRAVVHFKYKDQTGVATGLGIRTATGNITSGSTAILSVSQTTGVVPGQMVYANGFTNMGTTPPAFVTSVVGSTVNVSRAADGTFSGATIFFYDTVNLEGGAVKMPLIANSGTASKIYANMYNEYVVYEISPPQPTYQATLVIERRYPSGAAFTITPGTNSQDTSIGTSLTSTQDVQQHGICWSSPDEPEHVPPKNYARVGDQGRAILALQSTRDAMFIFKEDGVFRLSGLDGGYRIDPFDPSALCVLPSSVCLLRNAIFFLSSNGLMRIGEDGSEVVSAPIQDELAKLISAIRRESMTNGGLYYLPSMTGTATGTVDDANGEYFLLITGSVGGSYGGHVLVYSAGQQGFTTHTYLDDTPIALAKDRMGQPQIISTDNVCTQTSQAFSEARWVRVRSHAFMDPELVGRTWSHVVVGFSELREVLSVAFEFLGSEPSDGGQLFEDITLPLDVYALGTLVRHPVPRSLARSWALVLEAAIFIDAVGSCVVELLGAESRENISNKLPTHSAPPPSPAGS